MTPLFDIAITLGALGLLVAAAILTKKASKAAASLWFSIRQHIRREPDHVGQQVTP